ncbi:MAG: hypothetical protein HY270_17260 [Deltaproteobacteria bacterium]|nr:hypothetical protein [Deltaproteobacteria bacterium]
MRRFDRIGRAVWSTFAAGVLCVGSAALAEPPKLQFVVPGLEKSAGTPTPYYTPVVPPSQAGGRWWNDPEVSAALELTPEQRKDMDQVVESQVKIQGNIQARQNEAREKFQTAIKTRDWTAARKTAVEWNQILVDSWGGQNTLKIEVLMKLTAAQHQKMLSSYPYLFDRMWGGSPLVQSTHFSVVPTPKASAPAPAVP